MSEVAVQTLLQTPTLSARDVRCDGACRGHSPEECAGAFHLVYPYEGVFARHLGRDQAIAEANQVLFFNPDEGYRISHPVTGGDACLSLTLDEEQLRELAPRALLRDGPVLAFREQKRRLDPTAQAAVALLRHTLRLGRANPLEAETRVLDLVRRTLGPRSVPGAPRRPGYGRRRLADRVKLILAGDLSRRWTLADIAAEAGGSPAYLTQVFQQVEGVPLYRYQIRLRLARALERLHRCDDLTGLGLDLGFSSHSHFTAAFREAYGSTPSAFRRAARGR